MDTRAQAAKNDIGRKGLDKGIDLESGSIVKKEAQEAYETRKVEVSDKISSQSKEITSQGEQHTQHVNEKRDQGKRGLAKRSLSNIAKNIGGKDLHEK